MNNDWDGIVKDFMTGDVAMIIAYDSHASLINDYTKSKIAGNIGYSVIPGSKPVLGGWSLAINKYSKYIESVMDFILWACSLENAIPYSLLGGTTARKLYYKSDELLIAYPWLREVYKSYKIYKKRCLPYSIDAFLVKGDKIEELIAYEIRKTIKNEISEEQALRNIKKYYK